MAEVSMDYAVIHHMAAEYHVAAETLRAVSRAMEVSAAILKATAMFGIVGNLAFAKWLDAIKPKIDYLAETCEELSMDLEGAITSLRDGDTSGSQRFV
jgi:uncharacterized protein YukE